MEPSASKVAGEQIRALRIAKGWSLETLASRVGLTRKGLSKIELGQVAPSVDRLEALATELGVPLVALFAAPAPRRRRRTGATNRPGAR